MGAPGAEPPSPAALTLARSTNVLAWSFSLRCSIFTLLSLWEKGEWGSALPRGVPLAPSMQPTEPPNPVHGGLRDSARP